MWEFLIWFRDRFYDVARLLDRIVFDIDGIKVSLLGLMTGFLFLGFIISVFWKGGRE